MENKLKQLKIAFADVDNTLLYLKLKDSKGNRIIGFPEYEDWLKFNINNNAYTECFAPKGMYNLVKALHDNGVKVYGLTECTNSFEYNSKYNRIRECYPGIFTHHGDLISISDKKLKVAIMEEIAKRENISHKEIMFIDDSYTEVMQAFSAGFLSMHTTEALERFHEGLTLTNNKENENLEDFDFEPEI